MRKILTLGFWLLFTPTLFAQNDSINPESFMRPIVISDACLDQGITIGIDFYRYLYGEIDFYRSRMWAVEGIPKYSSTIIYGAEFFYPDEFILAPKIQGRIHLKFLNISLAALLYTDLKQVYAIRLRPEVGFGLWNLDLNYGYNIGIYDSGLERINSHMVTIRYYLKLHRSDLYQSE